MNKNLTTLNFNNPEGRPGQLTKELVVSFREITHKFIKKYKGKENNMDMLSSLAFSSLALTREQMILIAHTHIPKEIQKEMLKDMKDAFEIYYEEMLQLINKETLQ